MLVKELKQENEIMNIINMVELFKIGNGFRHTLQRVYKMIETPHIPIILFLLYLVVTKIMKFNYKNCGKII